MAKNFLKVTPTLEDYWRSIILFGRNTASYKFALANSLLYFGSLQKDEIKIDDMAEKFSKHICQHLIKNDKQDTSASNSYLNKCRQFNAGKIEKNALIDATKTDGFRYVFDAFHNIAGGTLPITFYSRTKGNNGTVTLHDKFFKLIEKSGSKDFLQENEARWSLVETAWKLNLNENLISLNYDNETQMIMVPDKLRRQNITSARDALNGYQKGHCFYCFSKISITSRDEDLADVDHFLPHMLGYTIRNTNFNGIWNLVLACQNCNRGPNGKFQKIPTLDLLERLYSRNSFLIDSLHPLRETPIIQTGKSNKHRRSFLQNAYNDAIKRLVITWSPVFEQAPRF